MASHLPGGVVVAQGTLDPLTLVRIQAGQPLLWLRAGTESPSVETSDTGQVVTHVSENAIKSVLLL